MTGFIYPNMNGVLHELWLKQNGYKTAGFEVSEDGKVTVFIEEGPKEENKEENKKAAARAALRAT